MRSADDAMLRTMGVAALRPRRTRERASVERLHERIGGLVLERQALRERGARQDVLERNRIAIARCQRDLSYALIERFLAPPAQ